MSQQPNDLTSASRLLDIIFFIILIYLIIGSITYWATRPEKPASEKHQQNSGRAMQPIQRAVINNTRNRHATSSLATNGGNRSVCSRYELNLSGDA